MCGCKGETLNCQESAAKEGLSRGNATGMNQSGPRRPTRWEGTACSPGSPFRKAEGLVHTTGLCALAAGSQGTFAFMLSFLVKFLLLLLLQHLPWVIFRHVGILAHVTLSKAHTLVSTKRPSQGSV